MSTLCGGRERLGAELTISEGSGATGGLPASALAHVPQAGKPAVATPMDVSGDWI